MPIQDRYRVPVSNERYAQFCIKGCANLHLEAPGKASMCGVEVSDLRRTRLKTSILLGDWIRRVRLYTLY